MRIKIEKKGYDEEWSMRAHFREPMVGVNRYVRSFVPLPSEL